MLLLALLAGPTKESTASIPPAPSSGDATFANAESFEAKGDFEQAIGIYDRVANANQDPKAADAAYARAQYLRAHSEGAFEPLRKLNAVRKDSTASSDRAKLEALLRDANQFPAGLVRVETRLFAAEAYIGRLKNPKAAIALANQVASDSAADADARARALRLRVDGERGERRYAVHIAAYVVLGATLLFVIRALVRAVRSHGSAGSLVGARLAVRRILPVAVVVGLYIAFAAGGLVRHFVEEDPRPFYALGIIAAGAALMARFWGAIGSPKPLARIGRSVACAAAVAASIYLSVESIGATYLAVFGL